MRLCLVGDAGGVGGRGRQVAGRGEAQRGRGVRVALRPPVSPRVPAARQLLQLLQVVVQVGVVVRRRQRPQHQHQGCRSHLKCMYVFCTLIVVLVFKNCKNINVLSSRNNPPIVSVLFIKALNPLSNSFITIAIVRRFDN